MNRVEEIHLEPYSLIENKIFSRDTKIVFDKPDFDNIEHKNARFVFVFVNCIFNKLEIENTEIIEFKEISFNFVNCYIKRLEVENIVTPNCSLTFGSSIIDGRIISDNLLSVNCSNCLLNSSLSISNINSVFINYTDSHIPILRWKKLFNNTGTSFEILLANKMNYTIQYCERIFFSIDESQETERWGVYRVEYLEKAEDKIRYRLKEEEKLGFNISLSIAYAQEKQHNLTRISRAKLSALSLRGNSTGKVTIENSKIDSLYIREFSALKGCNLYNIKPNKNDAVDKKIEIHQSNLDDVWLDNVSFDSYSDISLYRNNYNKAKISSCRFPITLEGFDKFKTVENIHYPNRKDDNYYRMRYETFLQLKNVLEQSDGFYEAQKLRTVSLQALQQVEALSFWDKMILNINNLSNRHGISIARPLGWFVLISIVLYILYLATLGKIFMATDIDWKLFGYYFSFLDVTHSLDFLVDKKELSGLSIVIDYINKVVVGFLLFQFVAAFRKYIRK